MLLLTGGDTHTHTHTYICTYSREHTLTSACDEELFDDDEDECDLCDDGCLSAMRLAMP